MPFHDMIPNGTTETVNFSANAHLALDDPPGSPDGATTTAGSTNTAATCRIRMSLSGMAGMISASRVILHSVWIGEVGQGAGVVVRGFIYVNSVKYDGDGVASPEPGAYVARTDEWLLNPNTSLAWTKSDLDALECGIEYVPLGGANDHVIATQQFARAEYVGTSDLLGAATDVGSRALHLRNRLLPTIRGRLPAWVLDRALLEPATWTHYAGPRPTDVGWGMKKSEREVGLALSMETDLDDPGWATTVEDLDVRRYWVLDWDPMISEEAPGANRPGIPSINNGAGRLFDRASKAYVESAAAAAQGIVQVVEVQADVEKGAALGTLIEGAMTNDLLRSSFVGGLTGLTAIGTAGQTTLDTADLLFDPQITLNSLKITRNGTAENQGRTWPATAAYAANDDVVVSIDYKNDSGVAVKWRLQKSGGGSDYWDVTAGGGAGAWAAGPINNAIPVSTTKARFISTVIDVGTGTPTLTLSLLHLTADANGTISHIYHGQIDESRWASSRIVTDAATATRALDDLRLENFTGARVWPEQQGTTFIQVRPNWNSVDITGNPDILKAAIDANNFERLFYSPSTVQLRFRRRVAGTNYTADFGMAMTRGTLYKIAIRRTGAEGEWGFAPYTLDIFVNGVKGSSIVAVAQGAYGASPELFIGQDEVGAQHFEGYLTHRESTPFVLTDEECIAETS